LRFIAEFLHLAAARLIGRVTVFDGFAVKMVSLAREFD
jgi:hypothetical protein